MLTSVGYSSRRVGCDFRWKVHGGGNSDVVHPSRGGTIAGRKNTEAVVSVLPEQDDTDDGVALG